MPQKCTDRHRIPLYGANAEGIKDCQDAFIGYILVVGCTQVPGVILNKVDERFGPRLEERMAANDDQEFL